MGFDTKMVPRGAPGDAQEGSGTSLGGGFRKSLKKLAKKRCPGEHDLEPFGNLWASVGCFSSVKMDSWMSFSHVLFRFDSRFVFSSIFNGFWGSKGARFYFIF